MNDPRGNGYKIKDIVCNRFTKIQAAEFKFATIKLYISSKHDDS